MKINVGNIIMVSSHVHKIKNTRDEFGYAKVNDGGRQQNRSKKRDPEAVGVIPIVTK